MPALSTSTIAASDSASKAAVRSGTRGADKSNDGSPFAALLAATTQQTKPPKPQSGTTQAANNNDATAAKNTDPQTGAAQAQSQPHSHGDGTVSKDPVSRDNGKRDKKTDNGTDASDDVVAAAAQQSPQAPPPMPTTPIAAAITPVIPANTQATGTTEDDAGPDAIEATVSAAASSVPIAQPVGDQSAGAQLAGGTDQAITDKPVAANQTVPQPAPQPPPASGQTGPIVQASIATADDTDSAATDAPITPSTVAQSAISMIVQNNGPAPQPKASDSKPAIDKLAAAKSAARPQVDPQTLAQPVPATDDDAEPVTQTVAATPAVANVPDPAAPNDGAVTAALAANAGPTPAPNSKNASPANKPVQTAADANTPSPPIQTAMPSTTPSMAAVLGKDTANGTDTTAPGSDSKSVHIAAANSAPQPDAPQATPLAQPALPPPPTPPQGMVTGNFVAAPLGASTSGAAVTTALHIAASDADPTPTLNALAFNVAARSLSGAKQFEIRLDPAELGRVDVRLSIDASGKTQAHMTADQPQTLALLQKDAPTLTQALRDAGLDVSQSGLNFSLRGQDRQNDDGGNDASQGRRTNLTATRTIQAAQTPTTLSVNGAAADARVDIHV